MSPRRQRGVVAIELAFLVLFFMLLLPPVLFFGHLYWRYNVLQQAASNGARYLAAAPPIELTDPVAVDTVMATTRAMVAGAGTAARVSLTTSSLVLSCDSCGYVQAPPTVLGLRLRVPVVDDGFYDITAAWLVSPTVMISADLQVPYAN